MCWNDLSLRRLAFAAFVIAVLTAVVFGSRLQPGGEAQEPESIEMRACVILNEQSTWMLREAPGTWLRVSGHAQTEFNRLAPVASHVYDVCTVVVRVRNNTSKSLRFQSGHISRALFCSKYTDNDGLEYGFVYAPSKTRFHSDPSWDQAIDAKSEVLLRLTVEFAHFQAMPAAGDRADGSRFTQIRELQAVGSAHIAAMGAEQDGTATKRNIPYTVSGSVLVLTP